MTIKEKQDSVVNEFAMFDEWMDKYAYLIELGKDLPVIQEQYKTNQFLISGCQSRVWLHAELLDGKVFFTADSDAVITKGIVSLLIRVFSGHTPEEILESDFQFLEEIGLKTQTFANPCKWLSVDDEADSVVRKSISFKIYKLEKNDSRRNKRTGRKNHRCFKKHL